MGARGNNDSPGPGTTDITGVNWSTRLMGLRACGPGGCPMPALIQAFAYAQQMGAKVANLSFGGPVFSQAQSDAIAAASGVLFVAAAGNGGADGVGDNDESLRSTRAPLRAARPGVCCRDGQTDALTGFSNFGPTSVTSRRPATTSSARSRSGSRSATTSRPTWPAASTTGGTPNTWGRTGEGFGSPTHSLTDSPNANYADNQNNFARTTNPINLSGSSSCVLNFLMLLGTETSADFLRVEASTTPASEPWTTLQSFTGNGNVAGATNLAPFTGQSGVYLRFRLTSNASVNSLGAIIDDAKVQCTAPSQD